VALTLQQANSFARQLKVEEQLRVQAERERDELNNRIMEMELTSSKWRNDSAITKASSSVRS
jgi:hypothetical protein